MKIDILTLEDVKIGKFNWFSKWIDIAVYEYGYSSYLLQMRISRTNAKSFRCRNIAETSMANIGNLTQMSSKGEVIEH